MRIIAGQYRGTALSAVGKGDAGAHLRPTTDRVRESLFNILMGGRFGDPIRDARVLDLFAGTGALGLEALSRGAQAVSFVDNGRKALSLVRENIRILRAGEHCQLISRDATKLGAHTGEAHDLVFLDPPYGKGMGLRALTAAADMGWIAKGALIVWEENTPQLAPEGFDRLDSRKFGDTHATFLRWGDG